MQDHVVSQITLINGEKIWVREDKGLPPLAIENNEAIKMNKEVTEDIDKLKRESSGGTGKLSIKPMSDLIEPNSCVSPSPPLSVAEKAPPARTINGRRLVK